MKVKQIILEPEITVLLDNGEVWQRLQLDEHGSLKWYKWDILKEIKNHAAIQEN